VLGQRPTPADVLTGIRLLLLPFLWVLAYLGATVYLGLGLAIAGLTDVLDGPIARRTGRMTRFGSQFDSIADILLMISIGVWLVWLHPGFFSAHRLPLLTWAVVGIGSMGATLWRHGRLGDLHLYSAKVAGVVCYVFVVWLFVTGGYSPVFFGVAIGTAILGATETLVVALTRDVSAGRGGTIFSPPR
jgi:phosphatidylglycerophosphate synthase